jgi:hypothetical protein
MFLWNLGSLQNHPNLLQAMTMIDYSIVLVSSNRNVDHGTLPSSVMAFFPGKKSISIEECSLCLHVRTPLGCQAQSSYRLALQTIALISGNPLLR